MHTRFYGRGSENLAVRAKFKRYKKHTSRFARSRRGDATTWTRQRKTTYDISVLTAAAAAAPIRVRIPRPTWRDFLGRVRCAIPNYARDVMCVFVHAEWCIMFTTYARTSCVFSRIWSPLGRPRVVRRTRLLDDNNGVDGKKKKKKHRTGEFISRLTHRRLRNAARRSSRRRRSARRANRVVAFRSRLWTVIISR